MRHHTLVSFLLLGLIGSGCASKEFEEPGVLPQASVDTQRAYRASYSDVWSAATAALQAKKYPVASSQKDSGMIVTDWVEGKSDRLYSGYGDTRIPYRVRFKLTVLMRTTRAGVDVAVKNEEQYYSDSVTSGTDFSGSLYQWLPTESSKAKEGALLDEIATQLGNRRAGDKK